MGNSIFMVPGYVARPAKYGPEWLLPTVPPGSAPNTPPVSWSDQQGVPDGTGITFKGRGGTDNWFHFPISVPAVLDDVILACDQAWIFVKLQPFGSLMTEFWAFNGGQILRSVSNLQVVGDYTDAKSEEKNSFSLGALFPIQGPIGISVHVVFSKDATVRFTGAGVHLVPLLNP